MRSGNPSASAGALPALPNHLTEVGEYGLALEDMAGILTHDKTAITGTERADMLALAGLMKREHVPRALESCPQAGEDHEAGSR